jgi:hypothetical protein
MERINRQTDEDLYQPKIHSNRIRGLYALKEITGIPMTVLVDLAIGDFLDRSMTNLEIVHSVREEREPLIEPIQQNCNYCGPGWTATWELVTDKGQEYVCTNHKFIMEQINVVSFEKEVGQKGWSEVHDIDQLEGKGIDDIGDWKDLFNNDDL